MRHITLGFYLLASWVVSVGLLVLWGWFSITSLIIAQVTLMAVTVFLHRSQSHRLVKLHPLLEHFFRFWLWLTTGMSTKEWVSIHRKHHKYQDSKLDPHTPVPSRNKYLNKYPKWYGRWFGELRWFVHQVVLWGGVGDYRKAVREGGDELLQQYGRHTPDDWLENQVYRHRFWRHLGLFFVLPVGLYAIEVLWRDTEFWKVVVIWLVQVNVIPVLAAGVINGVGHAWGYRNYNTKDASRNITPVGLLIGGEELHNNHHGESTNPKLSRKPWEFDIGWFWINLFQFFGLAHSK